MALNTTTLPMWPLPLLLLFPLFLLVTKKIAVAAKQNTQLLPPGPPKLPLLGNLHQIGALLHQSLWQLSRKYGPVMLLHFARIPVVVISSAEAAREVLKTHDLACCSRPPLSGIGRLTYNYKDVGFAPYGHNWRNMRKLIVLELFSSKRVQSFRFIREEEVRLLIDSISESTSTAAPVNLSEKLFAVTANIVFRMAFGFNYRGTEFDKGKFHEVVHEAEAVMGRISAAEYFPYFGWIIDRLTGHHSRAEKVFREIDNFFQYVIDDHFRPGRKTDHDDMIDVLLRVEKQQTEEAGGSQFTNENIKAVLLLMRLDDGMAGSVVEKHS
ncbi:hypothetical protein Tsubulata_047449 [Turnera subulata]|uniref:Cytochrome P450 n=1 Tax=Turnera subulata TaxID=218843 RepID=A0A9Q0JCT8_9ROSI|nr:hypothetical protein Tsubulata_047449 [Turnera subulata]